VRVYQFRHIRAARRLYPGAAGSRLAPRSVVRIAEHREVLEVARDAPLKIVAVTRSPLALDERQVASAPTAPATRGAPPLQAPAQPRPLSADDESDGASDQHDRDDGHGLIVVRPRARAKESRRARR
jgi:hypothetical protein